MKILTSFDIMRIREAALKGYHADCQKNCPLILLSPEGEGCIG
jgi:hypothetical protein